MYNMMVSWLGEANTFLLLSIVIVGVITLTVLCGFVLSRLRAFGASVPPGSPSSPGDVLNAGYLFSELKTVTDWHRLGINLGLETYELERIEKDYQGNERQMFQMLERWLQQHSPTTPWRDLVDALQQMGQNTVAEGIRQKYRSPSDPRDVLNAGYLSSELKTVTNWHQLGIELGLQPYELERIEKDYQGNERQMIQMLERWLQQHSPTTPWRDLVNALQQMGQNTVAEGIRQKYIRGRTPSIQSEDTGAVGIAHKNKKNIEAKFAILLTNVCNKLKAKTISVEDLQMFFTSIFPQGDIPKSSNIHEIFKEITRQKLWDYWNYYPLEKTAQGFAPDEEMKSWIEAYKQDLKSYKVTTKLIDHIDAVDSDSSDESLSEEHLSKTDQQHYKKLSIKLKIKFTDHTLMYIDELWEEFAELYGLPPYVALLNCVSKGCISIVWLVPSYLAPKILGGAPHSGDFYHKHEIIRVELDEKCIYQEEKKMGGVAMSASVAPSMVDEKYRELEPYQKEMEHAKETGVVSMSASVAPSMEEVKEQKLEEMKRTESEMPASNPLRPKGGVQKSQLKEISVQKEIGGYDCKFVKPPPAEFQTECLICQLVLREPYQTTCCGTSFCQTCIQQVQDNESPCPNCREENFQVFSNKGLKRSLNKLRVYCTHNKDGCTWSGELPEVDQHLNKEETQLVGCQFAEIQCEFHYAGCKFQSTRKDMAAHMSEQLSYHAELLSKKMNDGNLIWHLTKSLKRKDKIICSLQEKLTSLQRDGASRKDEQHIPSEPVRINQCFTMDKFQEHKENDSQWYSEPFYTHDRGYKMCLRVDANGYDKASGTHLSLFTCFMKGEFDSELSWPFYGNIVVELLNQNAGDHHHEYTIYYNQTTTEYAGRWRISTRSRGWGNSHFISHAKLLKKSSKVRYLKDDCLKFRVREVLHTSDSGRVNTIGSTIYTHWPLVLLFVVIFFACLGFILLYCKLECF